MATLPRRATAIAVAVALAGVVATMLMIVRAVLIPPIGALWTVAHPELGPNEVRVSIIDTTGDALVIYAADHSPTPLHCSIRWIEELPLQSVAGQPAQERHGITWRPIWETVGEVPPRGQEVYAACTFDDNHGLSGNFVVGPRELPQESPRDWYRGAAVTGAATLLWVIVAAVVLVRRSA